MSRRKQKIKFSSGACIFCGSDENNEFLYGKFLHSGSLTVHQNCLFFSSGLKQRGKNDSDGILGFLKSDIKAEVARAQRLRCFYCKKGKAAIGCCDNFCRRSFHFPCGIKHHSLHQHFGSFMSFCSLHKPKQDSIATSKEEFFCRICFLSLVGENSETYLRSPCCKANWYHRTCLQEYALSAGRAHFKCPLCNNNSKFLKEMLFYGIAIPDQDASWELAENAFQELLYRPECGAVTCNCKSGRKYSGKKNWALLTCKICGSNARHKFCENLPDTVKSWICHECKCFENKIAESKRLEVTCKEKQNIQQPNSRTHLLSLGSPSKRKLSSDSSTTSLKSITNTLIITVKTPVISDSGSSQIEIISHTKTTTKSSVKRKSEHELQPSKKKSITAPLGSIMSTKNHMKSAQQTKLKFRTSDTYAPYIVKCASAKLSKAPLNHSSKKKNKIPDSPCCSNANQCIKKMFGLECHNYRI